MTAYVYVYIKTLLGTVLSPTWPAAVQVVSWLHTEGSCSSHSTEALFSTPIQLEHNISSKSSSQIYYSGTEPLHVLTSSVTEYSQSPHLQPNQFLDDGYKVSCFETLISHKHTVNTHFIPGNLFHTIKIPNYHEVNWKGKQNTHIVHDFKNIYVYDVKTLTHYKCRADKTHFKILTYHHKNFYAQSSFSPVQDCVHYWKDSDKENVASSESSKYNLITRVGAWAFKMESNSSRLRLQWDEKPGECQLLVFQTVCQ